MKNLKFLKHLRLTVMLVGAMMLSATAKSAVQKTEKTDVCIVCDDNNCPIPGVVVSVKNRNLTVSTDADGTFPWNYNYGDVLVFTHIGYLKKEVKVGKLKNHQFIVHLINRFVNNDKDISGPYGQKWTAAENLGAVSTVYTSDLEKYLSTDILTSLQGRMVGFNIPQYRGSVLPRLDGNTRNDLIGSLPSSFGQGASGDNSRFFYNSRGNSPVILVDGVERELLDIDPEMIESVSLQRDALSSMFLGMKSSRGALIITTKTPTTGKMHLSLTGKFGFHNSIHKLHPLSADKYAYLLNEALQNDGKSGLYDYNDYIAYRDHTDPYQHPDVNWADELLKNSATTQSYNLNVSGGGKVAQYFVSLGYMNELGLFKTDAANAYNTNTDYSRYMLSSKVNINITDELKASVTAIARVMEGNQPGGSGTGYSDLLNAIFMTPNNAYPIKNPDGSWGGNQSFQNNLYSQTMESGYISDNTRDVMATVKLNYDFNKLLKGLSASFSGSVAAQNRTAIIRTKQNPVFSYRLDDNEKTTYTRFGNSDPQHNDFRNVSSYQNLYGQLALNYDRSFGLHNLKLNLLGDTRHEIADYDLPMIPSNIMQSAAYNYDQKYFAELKLTESYFNRYAPENRWGTFWAGGLGWNIAREAFMSNISWIDKLKMRATFGYTGNGISNSGYYTWRQTYSWMSTAAYPLGESLSNGYFAYEVQPLANRFITYEKAYKLNIGVDASFLNKRLDASLDFYTDKYFDLLQTRGKSIELLGASYPYENIGKNRRSGVEIALTWQDHVGSLNYYVSGNWSIEKTELLYMDEQNVPYNYLRQTGQPIGAMFGLTAEGFFSAADIAAGYPVMNGYKAQPGDVKYKDLNNDGVIDEYDRSIIGGDKPVQYFGLDLGLDCRGFQFSVLWQGVYNRDLYISDRTLTEGFQHHGQLYGQAYENILARWTPETAATATYPRLTAGGNNYNQGNGWNSSMWMKSGNFIRLKNISFGYSLPETLCRNYLGGIRVKVFVNAENLLTFSACNLVDPEVTFTSSPIQRCIFTGINLKF